jgi:hypothetical protein
VARRLAAPQREEDLFSRKSGLRDVLLGVFWVVPVMVAAVIVSPVVLILAVSALATFDKAWQPKVLAGMSLISLAAGAYLAREVYLESLPTVQRYCEIQKVRLIDNEVSFEVQPLRQINGGFEPTRFMTSQIRTASPFRSAPMFVSPSDAEAYAAQFPAGAKVPCYQYYDDPTEVKLTGPDLLPYQNPYALLSLLCIGAASFWGPMSVSLWKQLGDEEE